MLILLMGCHLLYAKIIREKIDFTTLAMMDQIRLKMQSRSALISGTKTRFRIKLKTNYFVSVFLASREPIVSSNNIFFFNLF
jgi:hypothetical protein